VKFRLVKKLRNEGIPTETSCEILEVSRSGFYAWNDRPFSQRERENRELKLKVVELHRQSRGTYGVPRIYAHLKAIGCSSSKNRISKLMKKAGISGIIQRRFKVRTTDSNHNDPIAERIFKTEELSTHPQKPNQVWASDVSYIPTEEGFLYLATYLDLCTRKVVGFSINSHMRTELILSALDMALGRQKIIPGELLSHSDRGSQYASENYRSKLNECGIQVSMSRKGNCYDNSFAESFFATLKKELIYRKKFKTKEEAKKAIFEYIEVWYNRLRIHSSIGYMSPVQFEESLAA